MADTVTYPKGDLRRTLVVLAALDARPATILQLASKTGLDRKTVTDLLDQARNQAGVEIIKDGPIYSVRDWGIFKKTAVKKLLQCALNAHIVEG